MSVDSVDGSSKTQNAADLLKLSNDPIKGPLVLDILEKGQTQISSFTSAIGELSYALDKLMSMNTRSSRSVSNDIVTARSLSMGINYDSGVPANHDPDKTLNTVGAFSSISAGSFFINQTEITIDPATDSLNDVIDRINLSGAGVSATIDESNDRLIIYSDQPRRSILLEDGDSGFFAATKIKPKNYSPYVVNKEKFSREYEVRRLLHQVGKSLDFIFTEDFPELDEDRINEARKTIQDSIGGIFQKRINKSPSDIMRTKMGITFDFRTTSKNAFKLNSKEFAAAGKEDFNSLKDFLFGVEDEKTTTGFAPTLLETLSEMTEKLVGDLGDELTLGLITDMKA
jgi:flagellar capping protein FliD